MKKLPPADSQVGASSENAGEHISTANGAEQKNAFLLAESQFEEDMPVMPVKTDLKLTDAPLQFPAIFPTQGYITRGYDAHINHYGIDIAGKTGSLVFAAAEGVVLFAGWTAEDGNSIIIAHSNGFITCYKHNKAILKAAGNESETGRSYCNAGKFRRNKPGTAFAF